MILHAADQLMENSDVDDPTWDALSVFLERRQIMDFIFTVGAYALLALACNTLRIEREDDLLELAERYGEPPIAAVA